MVNTCVNGTLEHANYSSPVPVIGLYIATGTSVCLLFMLFDIVSAIRHRQRWIPCRLFSLNSVTLTLLSIVSKVAVDLTTPMPSVQDQLSKLSATTLICICIGFMAPSVANTSGSEYISNMAALTIFVVTVVVNVCIQLSTGLINLFIVEHIIIMCCMLWFPLLMWYSAYDIKATDEFYPAIFEGVLTYKDSCRSIFQRLKLFYLYFFDDNPQLKTSMNPDNYTMSGICMICFGVLMQASIRSLVLKKLKFCGGNSDYGWSMWIIVVIQIVTVSIGSSATTCRLVTMLTHADFQLDTHLSGFSEDVADYYIRKNPIYAISSCHMLCLHLRIFGGYLILFSRILVEMPLMMAWKAFRDCMHQEDTVVLGPIQELKDELVRLSWKPRRWIVQKVVSDLLRLKEVSIRNPLKHLPQLMSRTHPSQPFKTVDFNDMIYPDNAESVKLSSFTIVVLARIASSCISCKRTQLLEQCMAESYEIIDFVETRLGSDGIEDRRGRTLAKAVLIGDGFNIYLPKIISSFGDGYYSQSPLNRAMWFLKQLKDTMHWDPYTFAEVRDITNLINSRVYETEEELCCYMEQIFVDMLHSILAQLPEAIFKEMCESTPQDFSDKARHVIKLLFDIEPIEAQVQWSFLHGVTSMISLPSNSQAHPMQDDIQAENNVHVNSYGNITEENSEIVSVYDDVIVEPSAWPSQRPTLSRDFCCLFR